MLRIPDRIEPIDRRRVGRPTSLTPEVAKIIVDAMHAGNYLETAAALAGISVATLRNWLRVGRRGESPELADFAQAVTQARAIAEVRDLDRIGRDPSWQSAAWRLERRHPKRWGRRKYEPKVKPEPPLRSPAEVAEEIRAVLANFADETPSQ
jgi:hypothetical protein